MKTPWLPKKKAKVKKCPNCKGTGYNNEFNPESKENYFCSTCGGKGFVN